MAFGYFDATKGQTPESIARTRALVEALMGPRRAPANTGDGLMALGDGIVANVMNRRANESEAAGLEDWNTNFGSLLSGDSLMGSAASSGVAGEMAATSPDSSMMPSSGSSVLPGSLLSAIDSTEGAGAYDTLYGHAQRQGPFAGVDVSKMTVGEAMAFADPSGPYAQHVKGQIGRVATPMGRHQIVGTTLRNAVGELGIDPSTPFDSNTQDMVASHLARQRIASADTLDGKISALRSEWHGLRNVPRQQMAQIVADLENGQQVASLDPSAGMASAPEGIEAVAPGSGAIEPQQPAFDAGRFGDPINLAEMPANAAQMPSALIDQGANYAPPLPPPTNVEALPVASVAEALAAPPVEMAQAGGGSIPSAQGGRPSVAQLLAAANHPFAPKSAQGVIGALLEQEMKRNDPMTQMQLEKTRLELEAMRSPQPKDTDDIREYNFALSQGFQGSFPEYQQSMKKAGATNVTTNVGEGDKFYENLDKKNAETFAAMSDAGIQARGKLAQVDRLDALLSQSPQGAEAGVKQWLGDMGIPTEGLDTIQATRALLEKMVPEQRPPGSGPMSDADIAMFRNSLPRVIGQPGGNQLILQSMRGIGEYEIQMGQIADMVADRAITPSEGRERIRNLKNPLEEYNQMVRDMGKKQDGATDPKSGRVSQPASKADYDALPSGAEFIDPNGVKRRKP